MTEQLTGLEWRDCLLAQEGERLDRIVQQIHADAAAASECWMQDHHGQIERERERHRRIVAAVNELRGNLSNFSEAARPGVEAVVERLAREAGC